MNHFEHTPNSETRKSAGKRAASWLVATVGVLAATAALAQGTLTAVTGGLETGTNLVSLPGVPSGTLSATECRTGCPILRLRFDRSTHYYIGKNPVPYAKFREAASKGDLHLLVSYRLLRQNPDPPADPRDGQPVSTAMKHTPIRFLHFAAAVALTAIGCAAMADESEIFVGTGNAVSNERPNILFIIDTSGSMSDGRHDPGAVQSGDRLAGHLRRRPRLLRRGFELERPADLHSSQNPCRLSLSCAMRRITDMASAGYYVADRAAQWRGNGPAGTASTATRQLPCGSNARPTPASTATA